MAISICFLTFSSPSTFTSSRNWKDLPSPLNVFLSVVANLAFKIGLSSANVGDATKDVGASNKGI